MKSLWPGVRLGLAAVLVAGSVGFFIATARHTLAGDVPAVCLRRGPATRRRPGPGARDGRLPPGGRAWPGARRTANSAFLVAPDGEVAARSDKRHLVPFGEYVPLKPLLPFVEVLGAFLTLVMRMALHEQRITELQEAPDRQRADAEIEPTTAVGG